MPAARITRDDTINRATQDLIDEPAEYPANQHKKCSGR